MFVLFDPFIYIYYMPDSRLSSGGMRNKTAPALERTGDVNISAPSKFAKKSSGIERLPRGKLDGFFLG